MRRLGQKRPLPEFQRALKSAQNMMFLKKIFQIHVKGIHFGNKIQP